MGMANGSARVFQSDARQHEGVPDQALATDVTMGEDERFYRGQVVGGGGGGTTYIRDLNSDWR